MVFLLNRKQRMCMESYLITEAKYKEATMVNAPDVVDQDLSLCWSCLLCKWEYYYYPFYCEVL